MAVVKLGHTQGEVEWTGPGTGLYSPYSQPCLSLIALLVPPTRFGSPLGNIHKLTSELLLQNGLHAGTHGYEGNGWTGPATTG